MLPEHKQYIGIRKQDGAAICHGGRPYEGAFPKMFDSKNNVVSACAQIIKHHKRAIRFNTIHGGSHGYDWLKDEKHNLVPGDEVDIYEITFQMTNNIPTDTGFIHVGNIVFDKKKLGWLWK